MTSRSFLVLLVFGWAGKENPVSQTRWHADTVLLVLRSAEGRPSMSLAVELSTCGDASTELYSVAEEVRCTKYIVPKRKANSDTTVCPDMRTDPRCPGEYFPPFRP